MAIKSPREISKKMDMFLGDYNSSAIRLVAKEFVPLSD